MSGDTKTITKTEEIDYTSIDLVKIQVCSDRCHAILTSNLSFMFAFFVGFSILLFSLQSPIREVGFIFLMIGTFGLSLYISWNYRQDLRTISTMIEMIKEGIELPKLEELTQKTMKNLRKELEVKK